MRLLGEQGHGAWQSSVGYPIDEITAKCNVGRQTLVTGPKVSLCSKSSFALCLPVARLWVGLLSQDPMSNLPAFESASDELKHPQTGSQNKPLLSQVVSGRCFVKAIRKMIKMMPSSNSFCFFPQNSEMNPESSCRATNAACF